MSVINYFKISFEFMKYQKFFILFRNCIWIVLLPSFKTIHILNVFIILPFRNFKLVKFWPFFWEIYFTFFICNKRKVYSTSKGVFMWAIKIMTSFSEIYKSQST